jgi:hypothetical protein
VGDREETAEAAADLADRRSFTPSKIIARLGEKLSEIFAIFAESGSLAKTYTLLKNKQILNNKNLPSTSDFRFPAKIIVISDNNNYLHPSISGNTSRYGTDSGRRVQYG